MWDSLKNTLVKGGASLIGNAIGGPIGGMAVNWIVGELGGNVDPKDPVAIEKAINANPEIMFKIKELETKHKEKLEEMEQAAFEAEIKDKDSARSREIELAKIMGGRDYFMPALAILITLGFFGILVAMLILDISKINASALTILNIMIGVLGTNFNNVVGYFFGSSKGSADKTKLGK